MAIPVPMNALLVRRVAARAQGPYFRRYAASEAGRRRSVTVINDDGRVSWADLRPAEKIARTTQQTFNFGMVLLGIALTGFVGYSLWGAVISPDSKTSHFNRAVVELRASPRVQELIGPPKKINAYGDGGWNRWTRNASIPERRTKDATGREHLMLQFNLEGPNGRGRVNAHLVRPSANAPFEYKKLSLDVPGHATVYLYNDEGPKLKSKGFKFLGIEWSK